MKIVNVTQGSQEWHAHRAEHFNASDAPTMMGAGKWESRNELIHRLATGEVKEISPEVQRQFDRGHDTEAAARPLAEAYIGEELFPVVGVSEEHPRLSASYDGLTFGFDIGFEHKLWNAALAEKVCSGAIADDPAYYWQLEQQLVVCPDLQQIVFTVSDGTEENCERFIYRAVPGRREALLAGWAQFEADLAAYVPQAAVPKVVAAPVETLPAIICTVNRADMTVTHNLAEYRAAVDIVAERARLPMVTDQDFADRKAVCKRLRDAEAALKAEADRLIGQMAEIAEAHRGLKDLAEVVRKLAIDGENKVAAEEKNRKQAVIDAGVRALELHIATLQASLNGRVTMPAIKGNFAAATKNLRTIASFENAVDTELARCKIEANAAADCITENLVVLDNNAPDHLFLFRDLQQIITMPYEAFLATVQGRVATHKAQEEAKLQAERERIEHETRERLEREAREKAEAEAKRLLDEQQSAPAVTATGTYPEALMPATSAQVTTAAPVTSAPAPAAAPAGRAIPDNQPAMKVYAELRRQDDESSPGVTGMASTLARSYGVDFVTAIRWLQAINPADLAEALKSATEAQEA